MNTVNVNDIVTKSNVRTKVNTKSEKWLPFVENIKTHGLIQPIVCYEDNGKYVVIAGHRRLKAVQELQLDTVNIVVKDQPNGDLKAMQVSENLFREDLTTYEEVIAFKPNTLVYAIPANSEIAGQISGSDMGIVWHTEYVGGPTLADTTAKFGFDSSVLGQANGVWHRDATIKDLSGTVTLTKEESNDIMNAIAEADGYFKSIDQETFSFLEKGATVIGEKVFLQQLKAHANNQVRQGFFDEPTKFAQDFVQKYITYMEKEIDKVKTQKTKDTKTEIMVGGVKFIRENLQQIVAVYDLYLKLIEAKVKIIKKLEQIRQLPTFKETEDGYEVTGEEGFVAVDKVGNALKLVDRLEFSKLNFGTGKPGA